LTTLPVRMAAHAANAQKVAAFLAGHTAFRGTYTDIYTFDAGTSEVVWSSHKIGTLVKKVAIYRADCSFIADW